MGSCVSCAAAFHPNAAALVFGRRLTSLLVSSMQQSSTPACCVILLNEGVVTMNITEIVQTLTPLADAFEESSAVSPYLSKRGMAARIYSSVNREGRLSLGVWKYSTPNTSRTRQLLSTERSDRFAGGGKEEVCNHRNRATACPFRA